MKRTQYLGALREEAVGHQETVMGWVENKRDMGGVIFVDMRDREGTLQVVFDAGYLKGEDFQTAQRLRLESGIAMRPHSILVWPQGPSSWRPGSWKFCHRRRPFPLLWTRARMCGRSCG